jgi:hypothetical protein
VLALRRKRLEVASDARVLGSGGFTESLLAEAARHDKETVRLARKVIALPAVARKIRAGEGVAERELRPGRRTPSIGRARRLFCQVAVQAMGYSGAEVARSLGGTTSAVHQVAVSGALPEVRRYLKAL